MQISTASRIAIALAIVAGLSSLGSAATIGTRTITDAAHYGRRANANNTVTTFTPAASGTIKWVTITGTLTSTNAATWARSLRIQPSGTTSLATGTGTPKGQGYFYLSPQYQFTDPIAINTTVAVPGGIAANGALTFEAYSVDSESASEGVPGLDGRSTLTYTFLDTLPNGGTEYSGSLNSRTPTWNRAVNYNGDPDGTSILDVSATATAVSFNVQPFSVATAGNYTIAIAGGFDTEVFLYSGAFDSTKPLQNLVDGNDSGRNTLRRAGLAALDVDNDTNGISRLDKPLVPGTQYYAVTTTYANGQTGDYFAQIAGAGAVTLGTIVPEPGTMGILATFGAFTVVRLRRERSK